MTEQDQLLAGVSELVQEFAPREVRYFELNRKHLMKALVAGEDIRRTFAKKAQGGDLGGAGEVVVVVLKTLHLLYNAYKLYKASREVLALPAPPPSNMTEALVLELVESGYTPDEAVRIAPAIVRVVKRCCE